MNPIGMPSKIKKTAKTTAQRAAEHKEKSDKTAHDLIANGIGLETWERIYRENRSGEPFPITERKFWGLVVMKVIELKCSVKEEVAYD